MSRRKSPYYGIEIYHRSKRELWILRGNQPVLWTVPFWVISRTQWSVLVEPAMPLHYERQRQAIIERLRTIGKSIVKRRWEINVGPWGQVALPVKEGTDPETCFSWGREATERVRQAGARKPELRDFLDLAFQSGVGATRDETERLWYDFCNLCLHWWINHQRPVDMYVLKFWPTLLRANWRELLVRSRDSPETVLKSPLNLALRNQDRTVERNLEIEYGQAWRRLIDHVEEKRLAQLGQRHYDEQILSEIERQRELAIRFFEQYRNRSRQPSARIAGRADPGDRRFVADRKHVRSLASNTRAARRRRESVNRSMRRTRRRQRVAPVQHLENQVSYYKAKAEYLQRVSGLQCNTADLWRRKQPLPQSGNGKS